MRKRQSAKETEIKLNEMVDGIFHVLQSGMRKSLLKEFLDKVTWLYPQPDGKLFQTNLRSLEVQKLLDSGWKIISGKGWIFSPDGETKRKLHREHVFGRAFVKDQLIRLGLEVTRKQIKDVMNKYCILIVILGDEEQRLNEIGKTKSDTKCEGIGWEWYKLANIKTNESIN